MQDLDLGELMRRVALHDEWIRSDDQRGERLSLHNVKISGALVRQRTLARAEFVNVVWTNSDLGRANLGSSSLERVQFHGCDLSEAMLDGCKIAELTIRQCSARAVEFDSSTIYDLAIEGGDTCCIVFLRALLVRAKMPGIDLSNSTFRRAIIEDCDLHGSDLKNVDLSRASIKRTDMRSCNTEGCIWERTWLDDVQISGARGAPKEFTAVRTANVSLTGQPDERLLQPGDEARLEALLQRSSSP